MRKERFEPERSEKYREVKNNIKGAVPEVPNDRPHQPSKQSNAEEHAEQIETASGDKHL